MDNSINFKGAFLIKQPTNALIKNELLPILGKRKQIINNINDKNDVLYVVKNRFDKGIADVLVKTEGAEFKYYPKLNLKSGFDDQQPEAARNILKTYTKKIIDTIDELGKYFIPKPKKPFDIIKIQANNLKTIEEKTLMDITGSRYRTNIDHQSGVCSVYTLIKKTSDSSKTVRHTLITITPPGKYGISYARVIPTYNESNKDVMRRYAIKNGEIIFEYTEPGSKTFLKHEVDAKKHYLDLMNKYKEDLKSYKSAL